jgi:hypothetical protein
MSSDELFFCVATFVSATRNSTSAELTGWRVQAIPVGGCAGLQMSLADSIHMKGQECIVSVDRENVLTPDEVEANALILRSETGLISL